MRQFDTDWLQILLICFAFIVVFAIIYCIYEFGWIAVLFVFIAVILVLLINKLI